MSSEKIVENWNTKASFIRKRAVSRRRNIITFGAIALVLCIFFQFLIALLLFEEFPKTIPRTIANSSLAITSSFFVSQIFVLMMVRQSAVNATRQIYAIWLLTLSFTLGVQLLTRSEYGFWFTFLSFLCCTVILSEFAGAVARRMVFNVGITNSSLAKIGGNSLTNHKFVVLHKPNLPTPPLDMVVIENKHLSKPNWAVFLSWCAINSVQILLVRDYIEKTTGAVDLNGFNLGEAIQLLTAKKYLYFKRVFDLIASITLLLLLSPMFLILTILIPLASAGPAFFIQERIGLGGIKFKMYKFRSMKLESQPAPASFTEHSDNRITKIGHFIRKTHIDELPQLLNVIKGDMSIIGPRPEQVSFTKDFQKTIPGFYMRHCIRPGITGWAQILCGYANDIESSRKKVSYDLFYIRHLSLFLDISICIQTIKLVLFSFGNDEQ